MNRRDNLQAFGAGGLLFWLTSAGALDEAGVLKILRAGECVVMLRHTQTDAGIGDPPGYDLAHCRTQRNLSDDGRAQARRIGEWFSARQLKPRHVESSAWCRCKDTADLAFGRHAVWPALASTFDDSGAQAGQTLVLKKTLESVPAGQFDVWVTHQVNITALSREVPAMGEAVILGRGGKLLGRTFFS